ncbi:MAG: DUF58 domain-containing protein [Neisseria sp.]|nr:DUF58 domain-containing protein [Neisseria sp.]
MSRSDKFRLPETPLAEGESIRWRHLRIRPTGLGIGMMAVAAASWVMALNYSVNLAYGLAFWILAFALWAMLQAVLQLYGSVPQRVASAECFAGEQAAVTVAVQGKNLRERRLYLRFVLPDNGDEDFRQPEMQLLDTRDEAQQVVLHFPVPRRGMVPVPIVQIYTHAPFALLSVEAFLRTPWRVTVYPAPLEGAFVAAAVGSGEGESVTRQGRDDVAYLSPYQAGDPLKQVAWKQYAKSGKLLSKQMEEEASVAPDVISYRDYVGVASRDVLAGYLCRRVLLAEQNRQRYTLELPQHTIAPQNGQRSKALTALSVL